MLSQLNFLQSFVEDLVNLKMLQEGVFTLNNAPFDPNNVFDMVCQIFQPQAAAKGIKVNFSVRKDL